MGQPLDLTNKKFGRLTFISRSHINKYKSWIWNCKCDCGKECKSSGTAAKQGKLVSCGCFRSEQIKKTLIKNIVGQKFNRLTVIEETKERSSGSVLWKCLCDCGNFTYLTKNMLSTGSVKSCGCYSTEVKKSNCGPRHYKWNPNKTQEDRIRGRSYKEYDYWQKTVKERDNYLCQCCFDPTKNKLVSHHYLNYSQYPEFRLDINNGICLCEDCHNTFHQKYGSQNNNQIQVKEFSQWSVVLFLGTIYMKNIPKQWKTRKHAIIDIKDMPSKHIENAIDLLLRVKWRLEDELAEFVLVDLDNPKPPEYYEIKKMTEYHGNRIERINAYITALKAELKIRPVED